MSENSQETKKEEGSMPTEEQVESAKKELENLPVGEVIVRNGFKFARTDDDHVVFQKE